MWLGEQLLNEELAMGYPHITVGILADLPKALADAYSLVFLAPVKTT